MRTMILSVVLLSGLSGCSTLGDYAPHLQNEKIKGIRLGLGDAAYSEWNVTPDGQALDSKVGVHHQPDAQTFQQLLSPMAEATYAGSQAAYLLGATTPKNRFDVRNRHSGSVDVDLDVQTQHNGGGGNGHGGGGYGNGGWTPPCPNTAK